MGTGRVAASEAFAQLVREAEQLAHEGAWEEAADRWVTAAGLAREHGAEPVAATLYGQAGEGYRRRDRPRDALNALQLALALGASGRVHATLSAVLASLGRMGPALEQARMAEGELGLDAQAGVLLAIGTREELAAVVERMPTEGLGVRFRRGQLLRMNGHLDAAREVFAGLEVDLAEHPAGRGGARVERAEIEALQGSGQESAAVFEAAAEDHARGHRSALVWASRAAAARCLLDSGVRPLEGDLPAGLHWAERRGMRLLALDLATNIARIREDVDALKRLRDDARGLGLLRRAGRAGLALSELLSGPDRVLAVQEAARDLREDLPLHWRALVSQAEALHALAPVAAARLVDQVVTEVERAGMVPERDRLAALEG